MRTDVVVENPYTGELLATIPGVNSSQIEEMVARAKDVFRRVGRNMTPYERYEILFSVADKIRTLREQLANLITEESGKPIKDSFIEVDRARQTFLFSAEEARNIRGESIPCDVTEVRTDKTVMTRRVPLGVVAAITPFNFPLNLAAHKVGPAIAAGNAVILKPSSLAPLTALRLHELFAEAGCPEGLFQVAIGRGPVGEALALHKKVRLVSFTGSVSTGQRLAAAIGVKRLLLELGGNDPLLIMPDADLEEAAKTAVDHGMGSSGQRCTAVKRVLVHKDVEEPFTALVVSLAETLRVGDPGKPDTDLGPLITVEAAIEVERRIHQALEDGARLLIGGKRKGSFVDPTVLTEVNPESELVQQETFGPVLPIMSFTDIEEAIQICNSTDFGLQAGVFTNNIALVKRLFNEIDVGALIVNGGPGFRIEHLPFGGTKMSGIGREGVKYAIEEMTETKSLVF
ncbi:MAG: aldehyde dehydrogenase family protein [Deltaproteobacteria bacterium]|nr:aldehyde dehydrogenase family protein [Deltaproteobacteria bacterium]